MIPNNSITDLQRSNFLERLIADRAAENGVLLSDFEDEFLASYQRYHQYHRFFNAGAGGRREVADKMWMKYGREIEMPFPVATETQSAQRKIPEADPHGCEFLVFNESRRQVRCNEPAVLMRRNGFRYCAPHAEQVMRDLKRRGQRIELISFSRKGAEAQNL